MSDPEQLGKYRIRRTLGRGAMGIVYEAFDPDIERTVAIKTIRLDTVDRELAQQYMARFRNEARAAGRLQHPNIISVYEYGEQPPIAYIAMEFVNGLGLREYASRHPSFAFADLTALMAQLLDALEFAHARGVVHRDVKPTNLIVNQEAVLKVADFGIARIDTSNLTMAGMVIGTPSYMSPEQCLGKEADARSDVFSAGVVLYELLTGRKPFTGSVPTIAYQICHERAAAPSQLSALKLPKAVDDVVATAMAKDPQARYPSARAFKEALQKVAQLQVEIDDGQGTTLVSMGDVRLQPGGAEWDDLTLTTAEHELARFIGPLARVIVRKTAARTRDPHELCVLLSESIPDAATRAEFVKAFERAEASAHRSGLSGASHAGSALQNSGAPGSAAGGAPGSSGVDHATSGAPHRATSSGAHHELSSPSVHGAGASGSGGPLHTESSSPLDPVFIERITAQLAVYVGPMARLIARQALQRAQTRDELVHLLAENVGTQDRASFLKDVAANKTRR